MKEQAMFGVGVRVLAALVFMICFATGLNGQEDANQVTVDQILNRYIEALGGQEAIANLNTRVCTGTETTDLTSRQEPIYEMHWLEAYSKAPGHYYYVLWTDSGGEWHGYDGNTAWFKDKCGVREEEYTRNLKLTFFLNPQGPLQITEYFPDLKLKGRQELNGRQVDVLTPMNKKDAHYSLYFDVETGLLVRIGFYMDIQDYREVDGVLLPHKIANSRKGGSTTYEFKQIKHNVEIDDSLFIMPK
jgi:hypothetical protein